MSDLTAPEGGQSDGAAVIAFAVTALLIDAAVQLNQITSQKINFDISDEPGGRINSIYLTSMFGIGASGSLVGSASFEVGGWFLIPALGAAIAALSFLVFLLCYRGAKN